MTSREALFNAPSHTDYVITAKNAVDSTQISFLRNTQNLAGSVSSVWKSISFGPSSNLQIQFAIPFIVFPSVIN